MPMIWSVFRLTSAYLPFIFLWQDFCCCDKICGVFLMLMKCEPTTESFIFALKFTSAIRARLGIDPGTFESKVRWRKELYRLQPPCGLRNLKKMAETSLHYLQIRCSYNYDLVVDCRDHGTYNLDMVRTTYSHLNELAKCMIGNHTYICIMAFSSP